MWQLFPFVSSRWARQKWWDQLYFQLVGNDHGGSKTEPFLGPCVGPPQKRDVSQNYIPQPGIFRPKLYHFQRTFAKIHHFETHPYCFAVSNTTKRKRHKKAELTIQSSCSGGIIFGIPTGVHFFQWLLLRPNKTKWWI